MPRPPVSVTPVCRLIDYGWSGTWPRTTKRRADAADAVVVLRADGQLPAEPNLGSDAPKITVQIPPDIDAVKATGVEGVIAWRAATSAVFKHYFACGYVVRNYLRGVGYVLTREGDKE